MTPQQAVDIVRNFKDFIISFQKVHGFAIIDSEDIEAIDTVVAEVEKPPITERDMHLNMQYYMEYCQMKGYVTPMEWIEKHKHF